jgi:cellulose biosynthesis protein BcsQ
MKCAAIYNLKGGVGKTAAAVNLAHLSAREGKRTLLLDLDPQASASFYFRVEAGKKWSAKRLAKGGKGVDSAILATDYEMLDIIPGTVSFRKLALVVHDMKHSRRRLREALEQLAGDYDLVVLDTPPAIDLGAENVFRAADVILVPLIPTTLSLATLQTVDDFLKKHKIPTRKVRPFFSMVDARKKLHRATIDDMRRHRNGLLSTEIPFSSQVEKMGVEGAPLTAHHHRTRPALAFHDLWKEVRELVFDESG